MAVAADFETTPPEVKGPDPLLWVVNSRVPRLPPNARTHTLIWVCLLLRVPLQGVQ